MASISIPLEAVQLSDGGEPISPVEGETVSITVEGAVESVGDGIANIQIVSANGVEMGAQSEEPPMPEEMGDPDLDSAKAEFLASLEGQQI